MSAIERETLQLARELIAVSRRVQTIVGRALPGQIVKAGTSDRRYPLPDGIAERLGSRAGGR